MLDPTPYTEWGYLGALVFLVLAILAWVARENAVNRKHQHDEAAAREKAQAERDSEWRLFLQQQRENDNQVSEAVKGSLDALTEITRSLVQEVQGQRADFRAHDEKEWAKLDEMSAAIHSKDRKTQPRKQQP